MNANLNFICVYILSNHESVVQYREKYGITESYDGELLRLVSVQFPDEIEEEEVAQVVPPLFEVDDFIENEFEEEAVPDDYVMREDTDSEGDDYNEEEEDD